MKMTWCALLGMAAGCATEAAPIPEIALADPAGPVSLIREAKGSEDGGYDLFGPARPTIVNGGVWLLEVRNDQLVRFDTTLATARAFAREGEGPGEIQFAQDLALDGDRFIVAEAGNGRVSIFDTTGAFRASVPVPKSPRFAAAAGGRLLATIDPPTDYAYAVDHQGRLRVHAEVPAAVRRLAASDPSVYFRAGPYIATSPAGELIVLDQSVLALSLFGPRGELVATRLVPEPFRTRLLQRRLAMLASFGARAGAFVDSPAAKRIHWDREGRLIVLFSLPDAWGLLIDTRSWRARPLLLPGDRRLHDILWGASDATLDGDRLWVVSGGQLYQLAVEGWR